MRFQDPKRPDDTALAWQVRRNGGVIWHNGQTGGYHSFAAFSPEKRVGVVILCNSTAHAVDGLGFRLLQLAMTGEAEPLKLPKPIVLAPEALEPFSGKYRLGPAVTATVTREGAQLFVQLTGQSKFKLYPESKTRFFFRVVQAAITFEAGDDGKIKQFILHQNGLDQPAPKAQ